MPESNIFLLIFDLRFAFTAEKQHVQYCVFLSEFIGWYTSC